MKKITAAEQARSKKYLNENNSGVVPAHVFNGDDKSGYDRPTFIGVRNGKLWMVGTRAQCKSMAGV